jgi:hypothetical protein
VEHDLFNEIETAFAHDIYSERKVNESDSQYAMACDEIDSHLRWGLVGQRMKQRADLAR